MEQENNGTLILLQNIWDTQDDFNSLVLGKHVSELTPTEIANWSDKYALLLMREVAEFINELNTKPHREEAKTLIMSNIKEEWIDIFKYWLCLGRLYGFNPQDLIEEFQRKSEVVMQRFLQEKMLDYSKGKVVGVDIDGVLADYPRSFLDFINQELGTSYKLEQVGYNVPESLGLPLEECMLLKHKYRETGQKRYIPVNPGAKELLSSLREAGYIVVLLTARPYKQYKRVFADTQEWLQSNGLHHDSILWDENKNERLLRDFGRDRVEFFIEDVTSNANGIAKLGVPCFLINRPYNLQQNTEQLVTRVDSLFDIIKQL